MVQGREREQQGGVEQGHELPTGPKAGEGATKAGAESLCNMV